MERRPTYAIVDTEALKSNYLQIRSLTSSATKVMAVVKANAYGHGDIPIAKAFESLGCEYFGVAIPEEGVHLREGGISKPIVVLGGIFPGQIKTVFDFFLTPVIYDIETARLINSFAEERDTFKKVHVKIDTGMGRLGLQPHDASAFFKELTHLEHVKVEGVLSHFSEVDSQDKDFSRKQLRLFASTVEVMHGQGITPELTHMGNSAAIVDYKESHFNLVRPGIMLYGSYPARHFIKKIELRPAMQIKTRVLHVKKVSAGFPVSYNRTFVTAKDSVIATLPVGYGDGLPRKLSGKGEVLVSGRRAPMIGAVCMDLTMCDVTGIPGVKPGDEAVILGSQGRETITVEEIAERSGTISYEIFCNISPRVPRIYL